MTKIIDFKDNLRWSKFKLWGNDGLLTLPSVTHMISGILMYLILNRYIKNAYISLILAFILHFIEDLAENSLILGKSLSLEGLCSNIIRCNNRTFLDTTDHDNMWNFIGDNISFLIGSLIGIGIENKVSVLPTWSLFIAVLLVLLVLTILCYYYKK